MVDYFQVDALLTEEERGFRIDQKPLYLFLEWLQMGMKLDSHKNQELNWKSV